jgi:hypothetical protein
MTREIQANKQGYKKIDEADAEKLIPFDEIMDQESVINVSIDDLINNAGYTSFTIKNILIQTMILLIQGIQMTLFS